jgi:nitroreductase
MLGGVEKNPASDMNSLDFLEGRRSQPSRLLGEPGPTPEQLDRLLTAAIRVPDHGKLTPWRLLLIRGAQRLRLGEALSESMSGSTRACRPPSCRRTSSVSISRR